ncbi:DUF2207 domain-containing protein [Anaerorhabdus sp.]|uniref:DUF2207 domain-containing protein n=1 Tax=Anaerorhabdus sp. TaxID=1872524 RepID=UPI002FC6F96C
MIKLKKILIVICSIFFVGLFVQPVYAKEGFDIDNYDVNIEVKEDGTYSITETLDVHFNQRLHGIYLNMSTFYNDVTWNVDGEKVVRDYFFPINNIDVLSYHDYETDSSDNGVSIRLGDGDSYANEYETYAVSYDVHSKDLGINGIQTFYYNIISDTWDTNINHVNFKVTMPKEFDESQLYFYTDGQEVSDALSYTVNGNVIEGSYNGVISRGTAITIKLDLPENYFVYPTFTNSIFLIFGFSIVLLALAVFLFFKYGKDSQVVKTVEFTAPRGVTSAGVGYIIDGSVDNQDVVSLIFDWANKGYITITELKDDLQITKVKDIDDNSHFYEKTFFLGMFKNRDVVTTTELSGDIYETFMNTKSSVKNYFEMKKNRIYTSNSFVLRTIVGCIAGLPIALYTALAIYSYFYSALGAFFALIIILILTTLGCVLQNIGVQKWNAAGVSKYGLVVAGFILVVMTSLISFGLYAVLGLGHTMLFLISILITVAICIISNFMLKRTPQGLKLYGQILGLKEFILVAEKDRLDMLVRNDPQYFYNILPYAYALGLSDVWSEHFKDLEIPAPTWYVGSTYYPFMHYHMIHTMTSHMSSVQHPIPPVSAGEGRGGGFGGGGFGGTGGGFGGGGFSGGGFGGTSGGGW